MIVDLKRFLRWKKKKMARWRDVYFIQWTQENKVKRIKLATVGYRQNCGRANYFVDMDLDT